MMRNMYKKVLSLALAGVLTAMSTMPTLASEITLTPSNTEGTIQVTANVTSDYYVELPASVDFEFAEDENNGVGQLTYTADYTCGITGVLLGQKVVFAPKEHSTDSAAAQSHLTMKAMKKDSSNEWIEDTSVDPAEVDVTVRQDIYEWYPSSATGLTSDQCHIEDEATGTLKTTTQPAGDATYRGKITFYVDCVDL